jgi:hypothetical protein
MRQRDLIGLILLGGTAAVWPFTVDALHYARMLSSRPSVRRRRQ